MKESTRVWLRIVLSALSGIAVAGLLFFALNTLSNAHTVKATANTENVITTSGGMTVKMGKVIAELAQTKIDVGSGGALPVAINKTAHEVSKLMTEAGVSDTDQLAGNLTVCFTTVIVYKTELVGLVSTQISRECRNFTPGMFAATINTFAEDYTERSLTLYKNEYTFINKGATK